MGKLHKEITPEFADFIAKQKVFFVATAPSSSEHHINVSPRAPGSSVIVLDPSTVAMADLTGSGAETASHLLQNGRMTLLFVNIEEGAPRILRFYGHAAIKLPEEIDADLLNRFPARLTTDNPGWRAIYILTVERITTSCGYSMPIMHFESYRTMLDDHAKKTNMKEYRRLKNSFSIDGMPSISLLHGGANTQIKAVPEQGYVFGKPIPEEDVVAQRKAQRRYLKLQQTAARDGSRSSCAHHLLEAQVPVSMLLLVACVSFATGFAVCSVNSRRACQS